MHSRESGTLHRLGPSTSFNAASLVAGGVSVLGCSQAWTRELFDVFGELQSGLWQEDIADRIEQVSTEEAAAMTVRLARQEGLLAGTSTGCNVIAALRLVERLGPGATIVSVMCDTGMKYLSR